MKVIQGLYNGVTTVELDTLAAEIAATLTTKYPDYAILAARIAVSNLHKETKKVFSGELFNWPFTSFTVLVYSEEWIVLLCWLSLVSVDVMEDLYRYVNPLNGRHSPMVCKETLDIVLEHKDVSLSRGLLMPT